MSLNGFTPSDRLVNVHASVPRAAVPTRTSGEEQAFLARVRERVIGAHLPMETVFGVKPLRYFDFIASGRFHRDVEDELAENVLPYMANTHTETTFTCRLMT